MNRWTALLLGLALQVSAFNVDTDHPMVFWINETRDTGFGYSVQLWDVGGFRKSLVVGALDNTCDEENPNLICSASVAESCDKSNYTCDPDGVRWATTFGSSTSKNYLFLRMYYVEESAKVYPEWENVSELLNRSSDESFCRSDFNNDDLTDFVVVRPTYLESGRIEKFQVMVFIAQDEEKYYSYMLHGSGLGNFGRSISCIGDINFDGFEDMAVGSPTEDEGRGAVYIYHGSAAGINEKYSQRIAAKDFEWDIREIRGFGVSISGGDDIDDNYYGDMAVGAPDSSLVVLLRSRPVVRLQGVFTRFLMTGDDDTTLEISYCVNYTGKYAPEELGVRIEVTVSMPQLPNELPGLLRVIKNLETNRQLAIDIKSCSSVTVPLKEISNVTLLLELEYDLESIAQRGFCKSCPMRDPEEPSRYLATVNYSCDGNDVCRVIIPDGDMDNDYMVEEGVALWIWILSAVCAVIFLLLIGVFAWLVFRRKRQTRTQGMLREPDRRSLKDAGDRHSVVYYYIRQPFERASYDDVRAADDKRYSKLMPPRLHA